MTKEYILREAAKIKDSVARFSFRNETLVTTKQAMSAMQKYKDIELKEAIDKIQCLTGYLQLWQLNKPFPNELDKVIEEATEYINSIK